MSLEVSAFYRRVMIKSKVFVTLAAGLTTAALVATGPAAAQPVERGYDRTALQEDVDAIRDAGVTGVLAEVDTGARRIVARSGVADVRTGRPVPYESYFRIGSTTKTFVSVVILQLVAEGRMSLEDKVERWLPGVVTGNGNDGRAISVRQLLQHKSGLHDYVAELPFWRSERDYLDTRFTSARPEQLVAIALAHPPDSAPGTMGYSSTNYILAGMIIEAVTGHPWQHEVRHRVLEPLSLRHTFSPGHSPFLPEPYARGYTRFPGTDKLVDTTVFNQTWNGAGGDLISTTGDLTRFWQALLGGRLLRPAQLAEMRTTEAPAGEQGIIEYGLGIERIRVSCGSAWGHGGDSLGYMQRNGFTTDGRRGIVISESTQTFGGLANPQSLQAIDNAVCGSR